MTYAVLHAHDTYGSIGDSILYIKDYVEKAKQLGIQNLTITNHGSLATFVEFYETCVKNKIKPIIGCEFYYVEDISIKDKKEKRNHLILLAKNDTGLRNLIRLHNIASQEGFYYRPRIDFNLLTKYHEGLICLTACIAGHIPKAILNDKPEVAKAELWRFKRLFNNDFYAELQPGNFEEQKKVNRILLPMAKEIGIPVVITNDVHYLNKEDWKIHDYHVKDSRKQSLDDPQTYPDTIYYLMSRTELKNEMLQTNSFTEEEVETMLQETVRLADKVTAKLPEDKFMPRYDTKINEQQRLASLCWEQLNKKSHILTDPAIYASRLERELNTIHILGFDGYFLIVKDIIDFCDKNNIGRGPGRGSAVGSLVSYLLGISAVDPIQYGLMFERFLSISRPGNPDIDIDVLPEKRDMVYQHIIERYGADHCCFVSTFNKRKARAAMKTAARILGKPVEVGDMLSKAVPYVIYDDDEKQVDPEIQDAIQKIPELARLAEQYPDVVALAEQLQGYPSSMGIHPAGIVISPVDILDRYPLIRAKDKPLHATSLDLNNVEKLSGVKIDLLALANLSTICAVEEAAGRKINYEEPGFFNNEEAWNLIGSSLTTGLFQISSPTYKARMPKLKPRSIPELAACLALVRGPCISSGADKKYIRILHGIKEPDPICDEYWSVTKNTCGIIVYQEQVLKICQAIGMSEEDSYRLLKACSKKKAEQIKSYGFMFKMAAANKQIPEEKAERIWEEILNSAKYAFNTAHATAYAFLCYASAQLKVKHTTHYLCALLNKIYNKPDADAITSVMEECRRLFVRFLPLDINQSQWQFTVVDNDTIRIGFIALKGLGEKAFDAIRNAERPFSNLEDFLAKVPGKQCNKRCVELLILSSAFQQITGQLPDESLITYLAEIRKEPVGCTVKIGKTEINPFANTEEIERQLFGTWFPRKEKAA